MFKEVVVVDCHHLCDHASDSFALGDDMISIELKEPNKGVNVAPVNFSWQLVDSNSEPILHGRELTMLSVKGRLELDTVQGTEDLA